MFKTTAMRHFEANEIAASARQFKDQVQQGLVTLLAARLREGENLPDLGLLQELIGRLLDFYGTSLADADGRHSNELRNAAVLRGRRDELSTKLRERMRDVRYLLDRSVEPGTAKAALRDRRISSVKPLVLVQGARDLVGALRDPQLALEEMASDRLRPSAAALAATLETEAAELEQVLLSLSPQKKANQDNVGAKLAEVDAAGEVIRRCSDALFGLYRLGGIDFHAERLRPKARRKRPEEPEKSPPPASQPGTAMQVG